MPTRKKNRVSSPENLLYKVFISKVYPQTWRTEYHIAQINQSYWDYKDRLIISGLSRLFWNSRRAVPLLEFQVAVVRPAEKCRSHGGFSGRKWHNWEMNGRDVYTALRLSAFGRSKSRALRRGDLPPVRSFIEQSVYTYDKHNPKVPVYWVCRVN